jgi:5'-nucleotidase
VRLVTNRTAPGTAPVGGQLMRILVTNDDGIDSVGLHVLARALQHLGTVTVVAPDREYSGAGAALGALHILRPDIHRVHVDGVETAWSVAGPPALCTRFAIQGAFGDGFDLVVAGINPGANTSIRTPYHSGTIGAVLTGRNHGISGVAVSQDVTVGAIEGQAWDEMLLGQRWDTAAHAATELVGRLIAHLPAEPFALNVNVPNVEVNDLRGYRTTRFAPTASRPMVGARLEPIPGHHEAFHAEPLWDERITFPDDTDSGAVDAGWVSLTWMGRILEVPSPTGSLDDLLG